jgi:hypothetical protein
MTSLQALQAAVDAAVDDVEDEVDGYFSPGCPSSSASSRNIFIQVVDAVW